MLTSQMSNEITRLQQMLARYDDAGREIFGAYAVASRLFEFDPVTYTPIMDGELFRCRFTDEDLIQHYGADKDGKPIITAQEVAKAFFGAVEIANNIPTELANLIGKVRA